MVGIALILVLGIGAQWLAWRLRLPSILLLLLTGFLAGPVTHLVNPDALLGELLLPLVSLSVALILFEGGMSLRIADLQQSGHVVRNLVSIGAIATGVIAAVSARYVLGLNWPLASLLGAFLLVTGPTVIGPLLRFVKPTGAVGPILRWEGIVIDPIGAMIAVLVFEAIHVTGEHHTATILAFQAVKTIGIGSAAGVLAASALMLMLARFWIPDHLQNPVALAVVMAAFVVSNYVQPESGLFSVTVMGVFLANQKKARVHHIAEFKETLSLLLISSLFITLGARLQLPNLMRAAPRGLVFLAILILIARPIAVAISTIRSGLTWREKAFLAAMAPRGIVAAAVASVFSLRLRQAGVPGSELLVPYTFVVIIGTVIVYGLTSGPIGRALGLASRSASGCLIVGAHALAREIGGALRDAGLQILLVDTNRAEIQKARLAGMPTHYGSILATDVQENIELSGIGRLLAMTPSDEVNSLATLHFMRVFGRSEAYQLATSKPKRTGAVADELRGRPLFGADRTLNELTDFLEAGAVVKKTLLSAEFDAAAFERVHPDAVPLFLIGLTGELTVYTGDLVSAAKPGMTIISLASSTPRSPAAAEASSSQTVPLAV
jgi:NhaP-type Na+/H+ or K+/H+ antiporter